MKISIAEHSGFCYGVKRALRLTQKTCAQKNGPVYTMGDLIHNPQVIAELKNKGIRSVESTEDIEEGTVIIRSHGVAPKTYDLLKRKNLNIVDATCPIVKKIQKLAAGLARSGEEIIIVGNKNHPETQGLRGFSLNKAVIVESAEQAAALPFRRNRAVLVQSTQDIFLFEDIVAVLMRKTEELRVFNTLCRFTQVRQQSTSELAGKVDTLFVIGGKNSSNTNKLFQIAKRILPRTYFIERADNITSEMLKESDDIGISGGASTPPEAIQEAVEFIKDSFSFQIHRENMV